MVSSEAKGFLLFAGSGLLAVCIGLITFGALPSVSEPDSHSADPVTQTGDSPWDTPTTPCADASVKAAAQELREAGAESLSNSTLAHPDEVSQERRPYQEQAWRSLRPHEIELQHCLSVLTADS